MTQDHPVGPTIAWDSPVVSVTEVEIGAPIERVWAVLTDVEHWPAWNPDVKSVSVEGPVAEGSTFRWKAGPAKITSFVEHVNRPRVVAWSGKTLGIRAMHVWRLEGEDGRTRVRSEESYEGVVAGLLRRSLQKILDKALADGAGYLKAEYERRGIAFLTGSCRRDDDDVQPRRAPRGIRSDARLRLGAGAGRRADRGPVRPRRDSGSWHCTSSTTTSCSRTRARRRPIISSAAWCRSPCSSPPPGRIRACAQDSVLRSLSRRAASASSRASRPTTTHARSVPPETTSRDSSRWPPVSCCSCSEP